MEKINNDLAIENTDIDIEKKGQYAEGYEEGVLQSLIELKKLNPEHFLDAFTLTKEMYSRFVNSRKSLYKRIRDARDRPKTSLETISLTNFFTTDKGKTMLAKYCFNYSPPFLNSFQQRAVDLSDSDTSIASSSYPVTTLPKKMQFRDLTLETRNAFLDAKSPLKEGPSLLTTGKKVGGLFYQYILGEMIYLFLTRLGENRS